MRLKTCCPETSVLSGRHPNTCCAEASPRFPFPASNVPACACHRATSQPAIQHCHPQAPELQQTLHNSTAQHSTAQRTRRMRGGVAGASKQGVPAARSAAEGCSCARAAQVAWRRACSTAVDSSRAGSPLALLLITPRGLGESCTMPCTLKPRGGVDGQPALPISPTIKPASPRLDRSACWACC